MGTHEIGTRLAPERCRRASLISTGPVAQLSPTTSTCMASSTVNAALISVPGSIRPVSSIVTCACNGTMRSRATMARRAPLMAAFTDNMSNCVSMSSRSTPPSSRPSACSSKASRKSA